MRPSFTLRHALSDSSLLGEVIGGPSWAVWRAILLAAMGEALNTDELAIFNRLTGRTVPPSGRVDELWCIVGRRGGKSSSMAALAIYLAGLCDWSDRMSVGERGVVLCISPSQQQARVLLDYADGVLRSAPILAQLIKSRTADEIELTTGITIMVRSASFRRLRGPTYVGVIADEAAFWLDGETSSNPDKEILDAVRPALATPGGPLIVISSPYARRGEVWATYSRHYGPDGDPKILVAQGSSRDFNPSLPQAVVDRAMERDEASARAEFLGMFRTDVEGFVTLEAVKACVEPGTRERAPDRRYKYIAFVDPSGGSADAMTIAIAHKTGGTCILDAVREVRPPFSPEAVVEEFSALLKAYRVSKVIGDRYAGEWPREQFRNAGVWYETCDRTKSELFLDMLPLINSRGCDLLDHTRLISQLVALERHTSRGGKDSIDHPPRRHDDIANAVAGALCHAVKLSGTGGDFRAARRGYNTAVGDMANCGERRAAAGWSWSGGAQ